VFGVGSTPIAELGVLELAVDTLFVLLDLAGIVIGPLTFGADKFE
jgi:hypothetical protein